MTFTSGMRSAAEGKHDLFTFSTALYELHTASCVATNVAAE